MRLPDRAQTAARELFGEESPVGKEVRLRDVRMKVLGVLKRKGASTFGWDQDDVFIAPYTTVKLRLSGMRLANQTAAAASSLSTVNSLNQLYPNQQVQLYPQRSILQAADAPLMTRFSDLDDIWVSATSTRNVPIAIHQVRALLRDRHHLEEDQADDFSVHDLTEFSQAFTSTSRVMTNLLLCVALISLMVGGVGIMNIMLVNVTERTREIGLRIAVGARARDILGQFLTEAVLLCLIGGIAGILLGRGASVAVTSLLHWRTLPSPAAIIAAVSISALVGLVFGYYPAWKASRLDPIDALRCE